MLIDFSDALQVNVFTLGAVFLHLCKLLRLEEHPMFQRCAPQRASHPPDPHILPYSLRFPSEILLVDFQSSS